MRAVLFTVLLAGCDQLFGILPVPAAADAADAVAEICLGSTR